MTTPRDLLIVAMDMESVRPVEQGDLSLALAGAEVIDLLAARAIGLDGDRIVPGDRQVTGDRLMDEAAASLDRQAPYESVGDWLWRRGRGLAPAYVAALEEDGQATRQRGGGLHFRAGQLVLADSSARRGATDRWAADEPVLAALAEALGIVRERTDDSPGIEDDTAATVLAAVNDAVMELEAVRQRRAIEKAAFDNVWRGQ